MNVKHQAACATLLALSLPAKAVDLCDPDLNNACPVGQSTYSWWTSPQAPNDPNGSGNGCQQTCANEVPPEAVTSIQCQPDPLVNFSLNTSTCRAYPRGNLIQYQWIPHGSSTQLYHLGNGEVRVISAVGANDVIIEVIVQNGSYSGTSARALNYTSPKAAR
jgi:hypothetical protein